MPQVTVFFWIIKVLCTTVGETASTSCIRMGIGLHGTSIAVGIALAVVIFLQFRTKKYVPEHAVEGAAIERVREIHDEIERPVLHCAKSAGGATAGC